MAQVPRRRFFWVKKGRNDRTSGKPGRQPGNQRQESGKLVALTNCAIFTRTKQIHQDQML
jgi:hypothetical protein